jgi:hypothetical protein
MLDREQKVEIGQRPGRRERNEYRRLEPPRDETPCGETSQRVTYR